MNTTVPMRRSIRGRRSALRFITDPLTIPTIRIIIRTTRIVGDQAFRWSSAADGIAEDSGAGAVTGAGDRDPLRLFFLLPSPQADSASRLISGLFRRATAFWVLACAYTSRSSIVLRARGGAANFPCDKQGAVPAKHSREMRGN